MCKKVFDLYIFILHVLLFVMGALASRQKTFYTRDNAIFNSSTLLKHASKKTPCVISLPKAQLTFLCKRHPVGLNMWKEVFGSTTHYFRHN